MLMLVEEVINDSQGLSEGIGDRVEVAVPRGLHVMTSRSHVEALEFVFELVTCDFGKLEGFHWSDG